jgi:hypothetical protein
LHGCYSVQINGEKFNQLNNVSALINGIRVSFTGAGIWSVAKFGFHDYRQSLKGNLAFEQNFFKMLKDNSERVKHVMDAFENLEKLSKNLMTTAVDMVYHEFIENT